MAEEKTIIQTDIERYQSDVEHYTALLIRCVPSEEPVYQELIRVANNVVDAMLRLQTTQQIVKEQGVTLDLEP